MKFLILISLLFAGPTFANYRLEDAPNMIGEKIEQEVSKTLEALNNVDTTERVEESWVASRIRLLIAPFVAFDAKLLEIKVKPLLEFRWERKAPKGWEFYSLPVDREDGTRRAN